MEKVKLNKCQITSTRKLIEFITEPETQENTSRKCSHCGKEMSVGYCVHGGEEYYCSDDCLHEHYSEEEYLALYDDGNGDSYWTEWDD